MIKFTKMQGAGNDYVYIDTLSGDVPDLPALAVRVSERHFGIGADGLIVIGPSDCADFRMDMYNADGSKAEMCGNGVRCAGKYVRDKGYTDQDRVSFDTLAGIKHLDLHLENGAVRSATVDMGVPKFRPSDIPANAADGETTTVELRFGGQVYSAFCVSMGNPHAVIFTEGIDALDLEAIGPAFEHAAVFPQRANIEFIEVQSPRLLKMRVWERGSGETMACGTGACAALAAAHRLGLSERSATVRLRGGELDILWDERDDHIYMTGPAETVFEGVLF